MPINKQPRFWKLSCIVLLVMVVSLLTIFGLSYCLSHPPQQELTKETTIELENCKNLSLNKTAYCLTNFMSDNFFYNSSNQNISINEMEFSELGRIGGVCKHYMSYIEKFGEELGFSSKHITLTPQIKHGISMLLDNQTNEYCILEINKVVGCVDLK